MPEGAIHTSAACSAVRQRIADGHTASQLVGSRMAWAIVPSSCRVHAPGAGSGSGCAPRGGAAHLLLPARRAGSQLGMLPSWAHSTSPRSLIFRIALQRRLGLWISDARSAQLALAETITPEWQAQEAAAGIKQRTAIVQMYTVRFASGAARMVRGRDVRA